MESINLTEKRRKKLLKTINEIKKETTNQETIAGLNEIELYIIENKYGIQFEEHSEKMFDDLMSNIPVFVEDFTRKIDFSSSMNRSFILEGDNLHSLYLLQKTHKKAIDVIYIDPPYNTGSKDWKYNNSYIDSNDGYRHSKWLSMMSNRLKLAKKLLTRNGTLICAIDENELATLTLLIDDIFGEGYRIDTVVVVHNPRGVQGDNFSYTHEYALFVYRKGLKIIEDKTLQSNEIYVSNLRNWGSESKRSDAANCFYPIYVKDNKILGFGDDITAQTDIHPSQTSYDSSTGVYTVYPIDIQGVERKWRYARQTVESVLSVLQVKKHSDDRLEIYIGKNYGKYKTVWDDKKFDANENGTKLINAMVPNNDFDFPKSIYTVYECLSTVIKNRPNATVLDFFAGSGTTGHAVLKMNENLGGNRNFILCTNNDIGFKKEKEFITLFPEWKDKEGMESDSRYLEFEEKYGIARSITFPRIKSAIKGYHHTKDTKEILLEKTITSKIFTDNNLYNNISSEINDFIMSKSDKYTKIDVEVNENKVRVIGITKSKDKVKGIPMNLHYYKSKMIPKNDEVNDLSVKLIPYINEMIQLKYAKNLLSGSYEIIIDEAVLLSYFEKKTNPKNLRTIYFAPYILISSEEEKYFTNMGITLVKIPDEFFRSELQEVGEIW